MPQSIEEFAGPWRLSKEIADRRGPDGRFAGVARVDPDGEAWVYTEAGQLRLAGSAPLSAERRYLWAAAPGGVAVSFDDGRPFHRMPFEGGGAAHDCDPDRYLVTYDFGGWPLFWEARWEVRGPRKDYTMVCRYRR